MTYNQNILYKYAYHEFILHNTSDKLLEFYIFKHCTPKLQQYKVMLSSFNVIMSEKRHMDMDIYMHVVYLTVLLEYIPDCSIIYLTVLLEYIDLFTSFEEGSCYLCKSFPESFINCCTVPLHCITHSFCPATLNGMLGSCLQKSKLYRGVTEPLGPPSLCP